MKVIQVYMSSPLKNYNYIIYSEKTHEAIFVDPLDISMTLPYCEKMGLKPKYLLRTHNHHDHIKDVDKFLSLDGTREIELKDGEFFSLTSEEKIEALYTPGHVDDHFCYKLYNREVPFGFISGDTIFNAGVGNCKNGGNVDVLFTTIKRLSESLEDQLVLYPSHDYFESNLNFAKSVGMVPPQVTEFLSRLESGQEHLQTTIKDEKLINPFFRVMELENSKEKFVELRSKRDKW